MGGSHKKNIRAEKAKVKLKGAKLPKGLNVTKTDFKVRKITIREQLKDAPVIEGKRMVSIKEMLSRLKHHSKNFRMEALRDLRENINAGDVKILTNLGELTQGISAICLDIERETRRESYKVLGSFLAALPLEKVTPFFHVISSYLRCAMTHIQPGIQEDSMLMLDVLLQHVPQLVALNSAKIFQNFLEMISKVRAEGDKAGRVLTVNLGNQQTAIKWRSKILQRLQKMLETLAEQKRKCISGSTGVHKMTQLTQSFSIREAQHFNLLRRHESDGICDLSAIFCKSVGDSTFSVGKFSRLQTIEAETQILQNYINHLMPLLFDAWLEVRPQAKSAASSDDNVILSHDAAYTLKVVVEIIENLWNLVEIHDNEMNNDDLSSWFRRSYGDDFSNNFFEHFPYQQTDLKEKASKTTVGSRQKSKKDLPDAGGQFCLQQNIHISHLMSLFFWHCNKAQTKNVNSLLQYLTKVVDNMQSHPLENFTCLEQALRVLLYRNGIELLQTNTVHVQELFVSTNKAFLRNEFPNRDGIAAKVLVLLCDIAQDPNLLKAYGTEDYNPFLAFLPQLLLRPSINEQALISMSKLGKQKNHVFLESLHQVIRAVIENTQKIQVIGACNSFEGKKHIMNLFYWLERNWSSETQADLQQLIQDCITDKRIVSYFNFVISKS